MSTPPSSRSIVNFKNRSKKLDGKNEMNEKRIGESPVAGSVIVGKSSLVGNYEGEAVSSVPHGRGTMTWPNGKRYEGDWVAGVYEGEGTLTFPNGSQYEGQFTNGKKHGRGSFTWANGGRYEGTYQYDKRHGWGTFTWTSGGRYEGEFRNDKRAGRGTLTWPDNEKYEGQFKDEEMHGIGVYWYSNGDSYQGTFKKGTKHGRGIYRFANGDSYVGAYKKGKRCGFGVLTFANGNRYEGNFKADKRTGRGMFSWHAGPWYQGEFWHDRRTGRGTFYGIEGDRYEGEFKNGKRHGVGISYVPMNSKKSKSDQSIDDGNKKHGLSYYDDDAAEKYNGRDLTEGGILEESSGFENINLSNEKIYLEVWQEGSMVSKKRISLAELDKLVYSYDLDRVLSDYNQRIANGESVDSDSGYVAENDDFKSNGPNNSNDSPLKRSKKKIKTATPTKQLHSSLKSDDSSSDVGTPSSGRHEVPNSPAHANALSLLSNKSLSSGNLNTFNNGSNHFSNEEFGTSSNSSYKSNKQTISKILEEMGLSTDFFGFGGLGWGIGALNIDNLPSPFPPGHSPMMMRHLLRMQKEVEDDEYYKAYYNSVFYLDGSRPLPGRSTIHNYNATSFTTSTPSLTYGSASANNTAIVAVVNKEGIKIPLLLMTKILSYLDHVTLCKVSRVCRSWKQVGEDELLWAAICRRDWGINSFHGKNKISLFELRRKHYPYWKFQYWLMVCKNVWSTFEFTASSYPGVGNISSPSIVGGGSVIEGANGPGAMKNGRGRFKWQNANRYEGEWKEDHRHGRGRMIYGDGDKYEGEWIQGKKHGFGCVTYMNESRYEGSFVQGEREGHGVLTFSNNDQYDGLWKGGKKEGYGIYIWANGSVYKGEYVNGKKEGRGIMVYNNGDLYEGGWRGGRRHGEGIERWINGVVYIGGWKDGKRQGYGRVVYSTGDCYFGDWFGGEKEGNGTLVSFFSSTSALPPSTEIAMALAAGNEKGNEKHANGSSTNNQLMVLESLDIVKKKGGGGGGVYGGEWKKGRRNGYGEMMYSDGSKWEGQWKDDVEVKDGPGSGRRVGGHYSERMVAQDFQNRRRVSESEDEEIDEEISGDYKRKELRKRVNRLRQNKKRGKGLPMKRRRRRKHPPFMDESQSVVRVYTGASLLSNAGGSTSSLSNSNK
eukprot:TRINITY_DN3095_c0_g1_i1.p1 TRINITY_DN3095_c0_g1~~TRINITY_DN3095_c0_g1_i1.p1  ORF type:complete len:1160 (-),score=378.01 TRINITY_DN3095_c0_g1_i1:136-3615(-)